MNEQTSPPLEQSKNPVDDSKIAISARDIHKHYSGTVVLDGIDLSVERGQIFGYIGPNGSGKTTTVRLLTGMLGSFKGEIRVAGFDVREDPLEVKRRIGFVPENAALYELLTVFEFLSMVGELHQRDRDETREKAQSLLREFELSPRMNSRLGTLSKGMKQKVLICSALLHNPEILFLDEPLSGLDVNATILIKELIRALADSGRTVFYCSHLMDVVERVCDRIAILHKGKLVIEGSFEEIQSQRSESGSSLERIFAEMTQSEDASLRVERILRAVDGTS